MCFHQYFLHCTPMTAGKYILIILSLNLRAFCIRTWTLLYITMRSTPSLSGVTKNIWTQEMVFDPKQVTTHETVVIKDQTVNQVATYKYLGVYIVNLLCWKAHIDNLCNKLQQRMYFLRRLRLYWVRKQIMLIFYRAILESLISYGITAWYGNLLVQLKNGLANMHKTAMKTIGMKQYECMENLCNQSVMKQATKNRYYSPTVLWIQTSPIRRRFFIPKCKTNHCYTDS